MRENRDVSFAESPAISSEICMRICMRFATPVVRIVVVVVVDESWTFVLSGLAWELVFCNYFLCLKTGNFSSRTGTQSIRKISGAFVKFYRRL